MKYYKLILRIVFSLILVFLIYGCASKETVKTTTIYLQEIDLIGPINQSPIHLTDSSETPSITFSPKFSYNTNKNVDGKIKGHTPVNENGIFQIDTVFNPDGSLSHYQEAPGANRFQYTQNNLFWAMPSVSAGLDVDIKISRNFALFGGVNYMVENNKSLWGGNIGLGLFGMSPKGFAFRFDVGTHFQSIAYDAFTVESVQITGPSVSDEYVIFYHDVDEVTNWNPFVNLTINSCFPEWIFNFFLNTGYSWQTLVDFDPQKPDDRYYEYELNPFYSDREIVYDLRGESTIGFFHFTPGLTFNFADNARLLVGSRFYFITQLKDASTTLFILPMMQLDFSL